MDDTAIHRPCLFPARYVGCLALTFRGMVAWTWKGQAAGLEVTPLSCPEAHGSEHLPWDSVTEVWREDK